MRIAAIDLGSNSSHMLIGQVAGGTSFEPVLEHRLMIQLGREALITGRLDADALDRSHFSVVEDAHCRVSARRVRFEVRTRTSFPEIRLDLGVVKDHALLFERLFNITTTCAVRRIHGTERPSAVPSGRKEEVS
jgi:hypothetical protein